MMAQSRAESIRDTYNYGQYINQFPPNTIKVIREFERIQEKICTHKMSIMFNGICINEEMLPKYAHTHIHTHTHTHTHTHIYIYIYIYIYVYIYIYIKLDRCIPINTNDSSYHSTNDLDYGATVFQRGWFVHLITHEGWYSI